jgi:hypothetical protein
LPDKSGTPGRAVADMHATNARQARGQLPSNLSRHHFLDTRPQLGVFTEVVDPPSRGAVPDFGEDVVFD